MRVQTAKICFETIRDFLGKSKVNPCLSCTIVAENHFFVWRYELKGIAIWFSYRESILEKILKHLEAFIYKNAKLI